VTGFEMFCERCGTRYGSEESTAVDALPLRRRLLIAVGVAESPPPPPIEEPLLSFCLACRGYSCHACWNDAAGFCQTCVPLPEPEFVALPDPEPVPELLPMFAVEEPIFVPEPAFTAEPEVIAEPGVEPGTALRVESETVTEPEAVFLAEPETVAEPLVLAFAEGVAVEPQPELAVPVSVLAEIESEPLFAAEAAADVEIEPPLPDFTFEEIAFAEAEPEFHFDWDMDDERPVEEMPAAAAAAGLAAAAEPIAAEVAPIAAEAAPVAAEPEPVAAAPEIFHTPEVPPVPVWPAPVFRPLEPMGRIVPPPPPALQVPRMEFDLPLPPPAFLIARQPMAPASLPVVPAGLFDGPAPAIRPCATCDLPVSAKARFCRRCGSSQA
jgi:hypothetical protein